MSGALKPRSDPAVDEVPTRIIPPVSPLSFFFFYSTTLRSQGQAGCECLYIRFSTFVSLCWNVRTGWRCTGGLYKAGSVSALKRGVMHVDLSFELMKK